MEKENKKLERCATGKFLVNKAKQCKNDWNSSKTIIDLDYYNDALDERITHDRGCKQCLSAVCGTSFEK